MSSSNVNLFWGAVIFNLAGQLPVPTLTVKKSSSRISLFHRFVLVLPNTKERWGVIFELLIKTEKSSTWETPSDPIQDGLCVTYDKIFDFND